MELISINLCVGMPLFVRRSGRLRNSLKEQGHVTVNKPVISIIYIVVHT